MSLLDSLGGSGGSQVQHNYKINNLEFVANMLKNRNINPRSLAMNMISQNSRLNGQLKQFLINNGVKEVELKELGINI